ncbi:restriction endonuclease subunit S [uncultured Phocaeicola sp.]|mgnify:CR=1 FL=1|jgi:type I restriction enzyme S subunit|uniref:restriction endonuclease subunit S n=1 Tax=uncultured Phocaeicola sp. TaxID=990718 RepID=UPI0025AEADF1|nr:restriction endonuclease subunit S [uncultured Phocaeicola sp.]
MYDVPHLRFPEFSGEWERKRLKDVCNIRTGNKNTQDKSDNGIYPFYVRSQIVERINSWTFDGEAILTAGDGVGVGKVFHYSTGKIGVHQRVYILSDFKCDGKYLYSYFAGNFYNRVKRMSAKNSVDSVRMEMIADMPIALPSIEEQKKIGHLLALLDDRIATQNKIIEKLQSLIKGLAAQLTQSGTPNVRLCDCLECHSSTLQENCVSATGSYPVYGATGLIGYTNGYAYNGESILIVKDGSGVGSLSYANDCYSVIGTLNYLTAKGKYSVLYLYYALMAFNFTPYITGMAIPHIYFKDYGKAKVFCPSIENQIRIASLLHNIEQKLVVEQNLIISLSAQKSYLLRMLFI